MVVQPTTNVKHAIKIEAQLEKLRLQKNGFENKSDIWIAFTTQHDASDGMLNLAPTKERYNYSLAV